MIALGGTGPRYAVLGNELGAAVQARAGWGHLESKYDALLAANPNEHGPADRLVLLTRMRQYLRTGAEVREVTGLAVVDFRLVSAAVPGSARWRRGVQWCFCQQGVRWSVALFLTDGNAVRLRWEMAAEPGKDTELLLRPDVEYRSFHDVTRADAGLQARYAAAVQPQAEGFTFAPTAGLPLTLDFPGVEFRPEPEWLHEVYLSQEAERGLECRTDLFSPGVFIWNPNLSREVELTATAGAVSLAGAPLGVAEAEGPLPLAQIMERAVELFLARRDGEWTVVAGYPWFLDWGRDSLIFARGLMALGRLEEARSILRRFAAWEEGGSIPNLLRGQDASNRETSDAPLWLVIALRDLAQRQPEVLEEMVGARSLRQLVIDLLQAHLTGASHGVVFDPASALLWSPAHFTWMDTQAPCGTPREGYPICIQALWAAALAFGHRLNPNAGWDMLAARVRESVQHYFWQQTEGYLADCLHAPRGLPAALAMADEHLRPNQLFAITLGAITNPTMICGVLKACQSLLVPGALRTLAPQRVRVPLVVETEGRALHDPYFPYHARYTGPEQTSRKAAYHNGTAWPWLLPTYCEALLVGQGPEAKAEARRWLETTASLLQDGCLGQVAEIVDGDPPHRLRGCGAQAWSASEWVRVWAML